MSKCYLVSFRIFIEIKLVSVFVPYDRLLKANTECNSGEFTSEHVDVDGDGVAEAGRARVGAGVGGARVLHHEERGRHLGALVGHHGDAATGGVVRDYLQGSSTDFVSQGGNPHHGPSALLVLTSHVVNTGSQK